MGPPKEYSKEELEYRCKRCFAPVTAQSSSAAGSSQVPNFHVKNAFTKELDRIKQLETLFV